MECSYSDYIKQIKKVDAPRKQKMTNSYAKYDYWRYYSHNKPKGKKFIMSSSAFYKIIEAVSVEFATLFATTGELHLPNGMGRLEMSAFESEPKLDANGNLKFNAPIDWNSTLKLWYEDKEAREEKIVIRSSRRIALKCSYNKFKANYKNKTNMKFDLSRPLQIQMRQNYKSGLLHIRAK